VFLWLGGGGFVNEFKLAVSGHMLRQRLGGFEVVAGVNGANRVGIFVSHVHNPNGDFLAFAVLVGLGTVKENTAPACGWLVGGKRFPTASVHVEYRRPNQVYEDVLSNVADLGLVAYPVPDPKLEIVQMRKDPLVLICHPQHQFAREKSIKVEALNAQKCVSFEEDSPTRRALDEVFEAHGVSVERVMEFDNIETVKRAVEIGAGIAIVPEETVRQEAANHSLVVLQLAGGDYFRPLAAIYRKGKVLSPATREFIDALKDPSMGGQGAMPAAARHAGKSQAVQKVLAVPRVVLNCSGAAGAPGELFWTSGKVTRGVPGRL
jgi:hypothetical protein